MIIIRLKNLFLLTLVLFCAERVTAAVVVNIDFNYNTDGTETYIGQGAHSDKGNNFWNAIKSSTINTTQIFKASDGITDTGITFTMGAPGSDYNFSSGGAPLGVAGDLMQDYLYTFNDSSTPVSFSIGGLSAGSTYEIYIYSAVGGYNWTRDRQAVFTLDGVSQSVNGYSSATDGGPLYDSFVLGDNYLKFTVTTVGMSLNGSFYTPTNGEAEFNGLQIVQVTSIPEPATTSLILGTLVLIIGCRRSRSE